MKKRIERKQERIEAIRKAALLCRGVYSAVAREHGWGRAYVCSVMAGRNSSEHVLRALEEKLKLVEQPDQLINHMQQFLLEMNQYNIGQ